MHSRRDPPVRPDRNSAALPDFDPTTAANTGLELIENLVRWDLGGSVEFGNQLQGGAQVSVTIPLSASTRD